MRLVKRQVVQPHALIQYLDLELLFQCHHQLDGIQRVRSQIVNERGIVGDLLLLDAQLLGNDCLDLLFNRAHHSFVLVDVSVCVRTRTGGAGAVL